ncbi:FAD-binding domain-containing protein [Roseateles sp. DC23W]|uniref:FAD-binding domain-containing protein n=1 Tax=Pelomonas dachongensis TaxID=3299029 RepID=A0ABW7ETJ6_9BURK
MLSINRRRPLPSAASRRECSELAALDDRAIHAPWARAPLEMQGIDYPKPIVDHAEAREQTLRRYGVVKGKTT